MAVQEVSPSTLAEYELELAAREAELNRREAALRRAQESRGDADERTAVLDRREIELERTLEVEAERDRLRDEQARAVAAGMRSEELTEDAPPPKKIEAGTDWWSQQLGKPLEAA